MILHHEWGHRDWFGKAYSNITTVAINVHIGKDLHIALISFLGKLLKCDLLGETMTSLSL
jgi:hypothetical protein